MKLCGLLFIFICMTNFSASAHWIPDLENGNYKNPIIFSDYSDPDVIRVDDDFYMVSSSFNCMPGIPVLHSRDLVNWRIINHVYEALPLEKYDKPVHGQGSWAPSIRYHNGLFYVYFCAPHDGLFMATAKDPAGKWSLHLVEEVKRWEDPCPFWDDDGNAYLVRSKLRVDVLYLHRMSPDGKKIMDNGKVIFHDIKRQPVIEGPKLYKKDGYYYIFAPAGGVQTGWQTVLRSKNIYGPYEERIVLHQGNTDINGPHQGGLEIMGREWAFIAYTKINEGLEIGMYKGTYFQGEDRTEKIESHFAEQASCYLRVQVDNGAVCTFSYSYDGKDFKQIGNPFTATPGVWIGAKVGIFSINPNIEESKGHADFDWFRVE